MLPEKWRDKCPFLIPYPGLGDEEPYEPPPVYYRCPRCREYQMKLVG